MLKERLQDYVEQLAKQQATQLDKTKQEEIMVVIEQNMGQKLQALEKKLSK